jgi:mRNA-degrading endonuclease RelE of RelBE toxin-antitoxin system
VPSYVKPKGSVKLPYKIEYSPEIEDHLRALTARQRSIVLDAVDRQLKHQPTVETRNRKPMRPNPLAPWELRIDNLRVYYDVENDPEPTVLVRAVGRKERNRVYIGGEVMKL